MGPIAHFPTPAASGPMGDAARTGESGAASRGEGTMADPDPKTFFISYTSADREWAEWIAWEVEAAGHKAVIQAWDFGPSESFMHRMRQAAGGANTTIAVYSPAYFKSRYCMMELEAALAADPNGERRMFLPIRVAACEIDRLISPFVYVDLVGREEADARRVLHTGLDYVCGRRAKPEIQPPFPTGAPAPARPAFVAAVPTIWNVPARNPLFTGRDDALAALHAAFQSHHRAALVGIGGVGKTQTAAEYAYRRRRDYRAALWVNADTPETLTTDFAALARRLDLPASGEQDQKVVVAAVKDWLEHNDGWLLVLDNADDLRVVPDYLPSAGTGHLLLTTRVPAVTAVRARPVDLDKLAPADGARLLLRRAGRLEAEVPLDPADPEHAAALAISAEVDGLPLALDQAGAFIEEMTSSPSEYLDLYRAEGDDLRRRRGDLGERDHASVTTTFSLAFAKVQQAGPAAADLLRLCAFLAPEAIPELILVKGAPGLGETLGPAVADKLSLLETIKEPSRLSLLKRDPKTEALTIHRLVQAVLRDGMGDAEEQLWAERAVRAVDHAFPPVEFSNWPLCDRLLPHARICADHISRRSLTSSGASRLLNQIGIYLRLRAQYSEAESLFRRALAIHEAALGPEHPLTALGLNNLAVLLRVQGKLAEAEPLHRRALEIREAALGPDHPDTATSLNNLALLLRMQGKLAEAEPLFRRALNVDEAAYGPEHPEVATDLDNLALLLQDQGKLAEAEPLHRRALEIREAALGPDHPETAESLNNQAVLLRAQGKAAQAEPLSRRALAIAERALGPDHPTTSVFRKNLAIFLGEMGPQKEV
jgi:tetratricopeptide (TPR) repeat protein